MESLQHQLQEVDKRRNDLVPEHQKVQKRSQKIQSIQDNRKFSQTKLGGKRRNAENQRSNCVEGRALHTAGGQVDKNTMEDAEMEAELEGLQAGEERRGSNTSQTGDGCLEALWQQFIALGANGIETFVQRLQREVGAAQGQMPRREEGRRNSEDEQEQGRINQQLVLPAPAGIKKAHQRQVWSLIFIVFGVHLVEAEVQENQAHKGIDGFPWMRKRIMNWELWCHKKKREKQPGQGPKDLGSEKGGGFRKSEKKRS